LRAGVFISFNDSTISVSSKTSSSSFIISDPALDSISVPCAFLETFSAPAAADGAIGIIKNPAAIKSIAISIFLMDGKRIEDKERIFIFYS